MRERERERSKEGAGMSAKEQRIKGSNGEKVAGKKKARVTSLRASLLWSQVLLSIKHQLTTFLDLPYSSYIVTTISFFFKL